MILHHLIVDGVSWRLLLEDMQTVCEQLAQGAAIRLPAKTTSFKRWAEQIRAIAAAMAAEAATLSEELSHDRPRSEGFVMVPALKRNRNRRRSASG